MPHAMPAPAAAPTPLLKLRGVALAGLLPRLGFAAPAAAAVAQAQDAAAGLAALQDAGLDAEACRLLAHALPRREAVWWACMCARHSAPAALDAADRLALEAAEAWVYRGEDATRRSGFAHAQAARFASPEAWAAVAAFWCGESMAPAGQVPVPPAPHLAGGAVIGSVLLAAVRGDPARRPARLARFLAAARDIAGGGSGRLPAEPA
jgi:hypothetical protein